MAIFPVSSPRQDAPLSAHARQILAREHVSSPVDLHEPGNRAELGFDALKTNMAAGDSASWPTQLREKRNGDPASAWTYGQTMVAALEQGKLSGDLSAFDSLVKNLDRFKEGNAYAPNTDGHQGKGQRYYDDNAWIGLAFMQAYNQLDDPARKAQYLGKAREIFDFLKTGQQKDGGMVWVENAKNPTYNTCAEGPAVELALRLHMATNPNVHDTGDQYFKFADTVFNHMQSHLLIQDGPKAGLYADNIDTGLKQRHDDIWAYNEGVPLGAAAMMYQVTGKQDYLDSARRTARASIDYFSQDDRLWKQPPAFTAIYARNLLQLDAVAPDPSYRDLLQGYNGKVWTQALNPTSALFDHSGDIGHYGGGPGDISTLDQAALVQMQYLEALPRSQESQLS